MSLRTNNRNVAKRWANSHTAKSNNGQLSTDGRNLYSYNQLIGITLQDGTKVALDPLPHPKEPWDDLVLAGACQLAISI